MSVLLEAGIEPCSLETSSAYWEPCFEASALRLEVSENNLFLHLQFDVSGPLVQVLPTKSVRDGGYSINVVFSSETSAYRFTGKPYSSSTGLYYDYQRWYDPVSGRFLSPDPLRGRLSSPQSLNPYTYVLNIPTVLKDPTGRGYSYDENRAVQTGAFWKLVEGDEAATVRLRGATIASYNGNVVTAQPVNTAIFWEEAEGKMTRQSPETEQPTLERVPSPNGRNGGLPHQAMRAQVIQQISPRLNFDTEVQVKGPGINRFVDVVGYDKLTNEPVEYYQISKATLEGSPVSREVNAIYDIQTALSDRDIIVRFIPYNWWLLPEA